MSRVHTDAVWIGARTGDLDVLLLSAPLPLGSRMKPLRTLSRSGFSLAFAFALSFRKGRGFYLKITSPGAKVSHDTTIRAWVIDRIKTTDVRGQ